MSYQKVGVSGFTSFNKIPEYAREYKREYQFIRGINKEFKYFLNKQDNLNNGLFESYIADRIKNFMKIFLRAQEKGKLKDISKFEIPDDIVFNINEIKVLFDAWKLRYDALNNVSDSDEDFDEVNEVVYPGFGKLYKLFKIFYNKLNIYYEEEESDNDSDGEYEIKFVYSDSDSDRDRDSDSDSDSDSDDF